MTEGRNAWIDDGREGRRRVAEWAM